MKSNLKISLLVASILISFQSQASNQYKIKVSNDVPEGFENIVMSDSFYDIYLNNKYKATVEVTGENWIEIINPERIMANKNKSFISEDTGAILKGKFPTYESTTKESENHFVSFNPGLNEIHIITKAKEQLINEDSGFNWKANFAGHVSGTENRIEHQSLEMDSFIGYNHNSFKNTSYIDNNNEIHLTNAYHSILTGNDRINTGLQSPGNFDSGRFVGVSYFPNAKLSESSSNRIPIEILLKSPATITIKKGEQIIYIANHSEDLVEINANEFPSGNYSVDIEINYRDGTKETLTNPIFKEYSNNNSGFSHFSLGFRNENNNYTNSNSYDNSKAYASTSYNFNSSSYGDFAMGANHYKVLGLSLTHHYKINQFSINTRSSINTKSDYKINSSLSYLVDNHKLSLDGGVSKFDSNRVISSHANYAYFNNDYGIFNVGVSLYDQNSSYKILHNYSLFKDRNHSLNLKTSAIKDKEWVFGLSLSYQLAPSSVPFSYFGVAGINSDSTHYRHDVRHQYRSTSQNISSSILATNKNGFSNQSIQSQFIDNRYGQINAQYGLSSQLDNKKSYFNGSFKTGLTGSLDNIATSGNKNINQGIIVDLSSLPVDNYTLSIDEKRYKIAGGTKHSVELNPHKKYKISLSNENNPSLLISERKKDIYVNLNSVQLIEWNIDRISLLSARALINQTPVRNEKISSSVSDSYTDENGYFTIETLETETVLTLHNGICNISSIDEKLIFSNTECLRK